MEQLAVFSSSYPFLMNSIFKTIPRSHNSGGVQCIVVVVVKKL